MYKLRFNLQHGKHYKHWQISSTGKGSSKQYYDPDENTIILELGGKLINKQLKAEMIYKGLICKDVCAWIETSSYETNSSVTLGEGLSQIQYNPKSHPFWFAIQDDKVFNLDGVSFCYIVTKGSHVYVRSEELKGRLQFCQENN